MTTRQLVSMINNGVIIECDTVFHRRKVLELLDSLDFTIGDISRKHLEIDACDDKNTECMHPGLSKFYGYITCYRSIETSKNHLHYNDIADVVENPCIPKLDERGDD